jgi:phospholipase C
MRPILRKKDAGLLRRVAVILKENCCFDYYLGTFSGVNGVTMAHSPNPPTEDFSAKMVPSVKHALRAIQTELTMERCTTSPA